MTGLIKLPERLRGCRPTILPPNQFRHFYRGGSSIQRLRGQPATATDMPEDWIASTATRFGAARQGLSELPDGRLLRDAIAGDPIGWLGAEHVQAWGAELELLVKLLDAGQRLIVHAHPDQQFATRHLGCRHGKTEAWIVLATETPEPLAYLGFRHAVGASIVESWVQEQDVEAMLGALNAVPIAAGDAILVPAGLPHAIGAGVLIAELQEPTDFSVVLEWTGFDIDGPADGHLELGYPLALQCVDRSAWAADRLAGLWGPVDHGGPRAELLPAAADPFFRAERVRAGARLQASVSVLIATSGAGLISFANGGVFAVERGQTAIIPHAAGPATINGELELIRCRPPDPGARRVAHPDPRGAR